MRRIVLVAVISAAVLAATQVTVADEDVDMLIAYFLHELEARQTGCNEEQLAGHAGKRVVCGTYDDSFSAFRSIPRSLKSLVASSSH